MVYKLLTYFVPLTFLSTPEEDCGNDELKDAAEDKQHADEHPDVQEGYVGHPGHILPNLIRIFTIYSGPYDLPTELNIAVSVRRVVIPIPTLPGTDSAGMNRESQASTWRRNMMMMMMILKTCSPQRQQKECKSEQCDSLSAW